MQYTRRTGKDPPPLTGIEGIWGAGITKSAMDYLLREKRCEDAN
jgi:hypothetical protein